jgi:hypothetical protein
MAGAWAANGEPQRDDDSTDPAIAEVVDRECESSRRQVEEAWSTGRESTARSIEPASFGRAIDPTRVALKPIAENRSAGVPETPILRALRMIDDCQARYETVSDYVCTFSKRERIDGRLASKHVMLMKVRTHPRSIYLKFRQPSPGREAIYVDGRNDGKVLAHEVGLKRLLAGTLSLDPTGSMAMEDNRHPITHAGIGSLLDTVEARWSRDLDRPETLVAFRDGQFVGSRPCILIESTHPLHRPELLFYRVRVYIDRELGLPVRFEAYDWPASPEAAPELMEEYTYTDVKLNVGLSDSDFDVSNTAYSFGRF